MIKGLFYLMNHRILRYGCLFFYPCFYFATNVIVTPPVPEFLQLYSVSYYCFSRRKNKTDFVEVFHKIFPFIALRCHTEGKFHKFVVLFSFYLCHGLPYFGGFQFAGMVFSVVS